MPEIEEIRRRREAALAMGGPQKVARQRAAGRLTVRERIERLADPGSFAEIGALTGFASYDAEGRKHDRSSGHWKIKGEKLCLKQSHPFSFPFTYCTPLMQGESGTSWTAKAVTGENIRVELVKGVVDPAKGSRLSASGPERGKHAGS